MKRANENKAEENRENEDTADHSLLFFQEKLGHHFARPVLLKEALTHRSAVHRKKREVSNERLEFIGDRVLGLLIAEWLIERFPREQEGGLGRRLAYLVSRDVLAGIARTIGLAKVLQVSQQDARAGVLERASVLADALEAVIGALYLDAGVDTARRVVRTLFASSMEAQSSPPKDPKTTLQEWAQGRGLALPAYRLVHQEGPSHAPIFEIEVMVGDQSERGRAGSKQAAEQDAAANLLKRLKT
jgi:ribonuclease-3